MQQKPFINYLIKNNFYNSALMVSENRKNISLLSVSLNKNIVSFLVYNSLIKKFTVVSVSNFAFSRFINFSLFPFPILDLNIYITVISTQKRINFNF